MYGAAPTDKTSQPSAVKVPWRCWKRLPGNAQPNEADVIVIDAQFSDQARTAAAPRFGCSRLDIEVDPAPAAPKKEGPKR